MNFLRAFLVMMWGPFETIGPGYKWKQSVLSGAIIITLISPWLMIQHSSPYQGNLPPRVPLIRDDGRFIFGNEHHGFKSTPFIDFKTNGGQIYRLQDRVGYDSILNWNNRNTDSHLYVEGFLLRNGQGLFWPTQVTTVDGRVLLDRDQQNTSLMRSRNPFGRNLFYMYVFAGFLWIFSIRNVVQIMKKSL
jgi:hypothetical protein